MDSKKPLLSINEDDDNPYIKKTNKNSSLPKLPRKTFYRICLLINFIVIIFIVWIFIKKYKPVKVKGLQTTMVNPRFFFNPKLIKHNNSLNNPVDDNYTDEKEKPKSLDCNNRDYKSEIIQRGNYWVLKNYIKADHNELQCDETVTYTTHADFTFLDNVIPLLKRWKAPLSLAIFAPGTDFMETMNSIKFLRSCLPDSSLVRKYTTFHIYFSNQNMPEHVPKSEEFLTGNISTYDCKLPAPYINVNTSELYKTKNNLLYPINVGRNIAREAALTHYILASDIELYPSLNLPQKFLRMIKRRSYNLGDPAVFALSIFEVTKSTKIPDNKTELKSLLKEGKAIRFHNKICPTCHRMPAADEWEEAHETNELNLFTRTHRISNWEPIYIGTHSEPYYDERLSWEGKSDKMTQGYVMCVLNYLYIVLDNAFLVHRSGIKKSGMSNKRRAQEITTRKLIHRTILPELQILFGKRFYCAI